MPKRSSKSAKQKDAQGPTAKLKKKPAPNKAKPPKPVKKRDVQDIERADSEGMAQPQEMESRPKNPAAVALGKLGGAKGGAARAANLSPARRKAIAKKAAAKRWNRPAGE